MRASDESAQQNRPSELAADAMRMDWSRQTGLYGPSVELPIFL
jgi:hypothetical protein